MALLSDQIVQAAEKAVVAGAQRGGQPLDYSEASLVVVEEMVAEAGRWLAELTPPHATTLAENFGCYLLEVARRQFGGRYLWHDGRSQPVLVVGEPGFRVAVITWDKVRGRLAGDAGDHLPFFYAGFAQRVRQALPGTDVLYV